MKRIGILMSMFFFVHSFSGAQSGAQVSPSREIQIEESGVTKSSDSLAIVNVTVKDQKDLRKKLESNGVKLDADSTSIIYSINPQLTRGALVFRVRR